MIKKLLKPFGDIWCAVVHDFILDKHKMIKAYGPCICLKCGRWWQL